MFERLTFHTVCGEEFLALIECFLIDDGGLLPGVDLSTEFNLADVKHVVEHVLKLRDAVFLPAVNCPGIFGPLPGSQSLIIEGLHDVKDGFLFKVKPEDVPDDCSLIGSNDEFFVLLVITEWRSAS